MNIHNSSIYNFPDTFCKKITAAPDSDLGLIVVIPCYNEPDLISTLNSLWLCERTIRVVEVIIVINSSEESPADIILQNKKTLDDAKAWIKEHLDQYLKFNVLNECELPSKHAGVGLARKIGMDEAWFRLKEINNQEGVIVCLDADCTVEKNYLVEIEKHFSQNSSTPACSIYFEHPLEGQPAKEVYHGIINYELHLRYYINGLRYCGVPYAYHTIGSSMAVRAWAYAKQGGMNKRKAGEDFYFIHKLIPLGNFTELNSTKVIPSSRASDRVPFGTGKAIENWIKTGNERFLTYNPQSFHDLKAFCQKIPSIYSLQVEELPKLFDDLPDSIGSYLEKLNIEENLQEVQLNTTTKEAFVKRFYRWFDGLKVLQYFHYARDFFYEQVPVEIAASALLELDAREVKSLLCDLRVRDRKMDVVSV